MIFVCGCHLRFREMEVAKLPFAAELPMRNHEKIVQNEVLRGRQMLVFCLLPIIATWCFLIVRFTPMSRLNWSALHNQSFVFSRVDFASTLDQYLTIDPHSNRLHIIEDLTLFAAKDDVSRVPYMSGIEVNGMRINRFKLSVRNSQTGKIDHFKEFDVPAYINQPLVIAHRFVVTPKKDILSIMDLDSNYMMSIEYPAKDFDTDSRLFSIAKTNNLVHIAKRAPNPITMPHVAFELYTINEKGVPGLVNSWVGAGKDGNSFSLLNDQLVTIHPTSSSFEFRSIYDGNIISSPPLPSDLDITKDTFDFVGEKLNCGVSRTYSLASLRWLRTPMGTTYQGASPDGKLQFWNGSQVLVVTDSVSEMELARFGGVQDLSVLPDFIDNENIVQTSGRWGITICKISARTGKTIMTWRPNWWALPMLILVVPGYIIWSIFWFKTVMKSSRGVWWDIGLIAGLPIGAFSVRFAFVGDGSDLNRLPSHFILGIFTAVAFVSCVWLWCSQQSFALRNLPLQCCLVIAVVFMTGFFDGFIGSDQSRIVVREVLILAVLLPVFAFLFRLLGFRIRTDTCIPNLNKYTCSIMDLLLVIVTSSLLLSLLRSIGLEVLTREAEQADVTFWLCTSISVFTPCVAWVMAMSKFKTVFLVGFCLSILAIAWLLFDLLYGFVNGTNSFLIVDNWIPRIYDLFGLPWDSLFIPEWSALSLQSTTTFISTFLLSMSFRYRGYRWGRQSWRSESRLPDHGGRSPSVEQLRQQFDSSV